MKLIFPIVPAIYVGPPAVIDPDDPTEPKMYYGRTGQAQKIGSNTWFKPDGFKGRETFNLSFPRSSIYINPDDLKRHCTKPVPVVPISTFES